MQSRKCSGSLGV